MPVMDWVLPDADEVTNFLYATLIGCLFAPWSHGLIFYLIYCLVYEVGVHSICCRTSRDYLIFHRLNLMLYGLLGWIAGRVILGLQICHMTSELRRLHGYIM
jgi:hypothetical protein